MFDIGFSELVVIALVALIVIGPERLPKVARTLGHLLGRMQRYVNDVKADVSREMELDELRKLQSTVEDAARSIEQSVHQEVRATESQFNTLAAAATDLAPAPPAVEAVAAPPVIEAAPPVMPSPAAPASPQLELGLDATGTAPHRQA
jgi:sec-independent protein translocase protein TatB